MVAGLLHLDDRHLRRRGGRCSGCDGEGPLPAPLAALTLGGIWNAEVVPGSRELLVLPLVLTLVLGALAAAGPAPLARRLGRRTTVALVALLGRRLRGWRCCPGPRRTRSAGSPRTVPAGGLLRDGTRSLALCAPLPRPLVAEGARWCARPGADRLLVARRAALRCCRSRFLPDAAWGVGGRLEPADYPAEWATPGAELGQAEPGRPAGAAAHQLPAAGVEPRPQGARPAAALPRRPTTS